MLVPVVFVPPFSQMRQARVFEETVVLKKRYPSAPITELVLLERSAATCPRLITYGSPLTRRNRVPMSASTRIYHSSPAANWPTSELKTKPSEPTLSDLWVAVAAVGRVGTPAPVVALDA